MRHEPVPFIVGFGRNGSTLLRLMLDRHPDLAIPPEMTFTASLAGYHPWLVPLYHLLQFSHPARRIATRLRLLVARWWPRPMPRYFFERTVLGDHRFADLHISAAELQSRLERLEPFTLSGGIRCVYESYAERLGKRRWGDKTPGNQIRMLWLQDQLPEAHFIHLIRDGRDAALSVRRTFFGNATLRQLAAVWRNDLLHARQQAPRLLHYRELRYEDLVSSPQAELQKLCHYIALPFHEAMLSYHETADQRLDEFEAYRLGVRTISKAERLAIHTNVNKPPLPSRIGRWRTEMTRAEQDEFWRIAGDVLAEATPATDRSLT
jgi:hypothetical protein